MAIHRRSSGCRVAWRAVAGLVLALLMPPALAEMAPLTLGEATLSAAELAVARPAAASPTAAKKSPPASRYERCKAWLRDTFVREEDLAKYGLKPDEDWQAKPDDRDIVVLVHGFNSSAERSEALLLSVREAGYPCAMFNYPNDDQLDKAAALLSRELNAFAAIHPQRKLTLLTHSAGGLVARKCVEDPALDPGNVSKLILIAPPNHGSVLARAAIGMDLCEHGWRFGRGGMRAAIADGMCEMRVDLQPCSEFLARLNAHGINRDVRYTILLGTGGRVSQWEMDASRYALRKCASRMPQFMRERALRFDTKLAEFDEIIAGRGDGAVAIRRARLDGVKDTVLLDFEHLTVTGPPETSAIRRVHEVVLDRLGR